MRAGIGTLAVLASLAPVAFGQGASSLVGTVKDSSGGALPGVTITVGRLMGIDRESAARFSFLLSIPIIAGAGLYKSIDVVQTGLPPGTAPAFFWGMVSSAVSGFVVIAFLLSYLRRKDFFIFMVYRIVVAALVLGLIATGVRS